MGEGERPSVGEEGEERKWAKHLAKCRYEEERRVGIESFRRDQGLWSIRHLKQQICRAPIDWESIHRASGSALIADRLRIDSNALWLLLWFADRLRIDSIALWLPLWLLIDWESIRLLSGCHSDCWSIENRFNSYLIHHLNSQSIENRFKILHQTSKCHKLFIRCPNEVTQKSIFIIFARRTKWRNPFFSIPWYAKWGG